jgi:hypothetical protein
VKKQIPSDSFLKLKSSKKTLFSSYQTRDRRGQACSVVLLAWVESPGALT